MSTRKSKRPDSDRNWLFHRQSIDLEETSGSPALWTIGYGTIPTIINGVDRYETRRLDWRVGVGQMASLGGMGE